MLSRSRTRARSFMRPPQWATGAAKPRGAGAGRAGPRVSTGRPTVKRINSAQGQYRQSAPVRAGLAGGLVCACGAGGVSVGAGSGSGGMTSGRHGEAGASTPL
jgi:hypothetical protein